jgi:imidazolonepropionase-like amidohydrolase/Tol biopolymer transport system component
MTVVTWSRRITLVLGAIPWNGGVQRAVGDTVAREGAPATPDTIGLPLPLNRTIRFRTHEGTNISVDVSPDGSTIAFDLLGELYTLPVHGGLAKRLLDPGAAFDQQPRYAPDGKHLAFISDRSGSENLWVADADGQHARQLSDLHGYVGYGAITSPVWSPDGRTIAVAQRPVLDSHATTITDLPGEPFLLASYDVASSHMVWLSDTTPSRAFQAMGPAFSPDGHTLFAAADMFASSGADALQHWYIIRVDLQTRITQPDMGPFVNRMGIRPLVSPDGESIITVSGRGAHFGLLLRDLRTFRQRWLVASGLDVPSSGASVRQASDLAPAYAFTPDGKAIIAAYGGKIHRIDVGSSRVTEIPFAVDVERSVAALGTHEFALPDTATRTHSVDQPALSPDGRWVAFSALDRIWVMELPHDGLTAGPPRRLTRDSVGEFYPSWSPDGQWIVYSSWMDGVGGAVRRAYLRPPTVLPVSSEWLSTDTAFYLNTAVSPDGSRIVAVRVPLQPERQLTYDETFAPFVSSVPIAPVSLCWIPASGGDPRTITRLDPSMIELYTRYPSGQLYFTADTGRISVGATSWRWDGTDQRTELVATGPLVVWDKVGHSTTNIVLSPTARRGFITRKSALFEFTSPTRTSTHDTIDLIQARTRPFGDSAGAAKRWGTAFFPWISWSRDGRRVLFHQGGTLFLGDVGDAWTSFTRIDVPLMVPVDVPHGTLVLHGGRLLTMREHEVIPHGDILVRNNRIAAIGPEGSFEWPRDATVLNVRGKTVLPGYIEMHLHELLPHGVHSQQLWSRLALLSVGVTATRDPSPGYNDIFTYRELERTGAFLGPRFFATGVVTFGEDPIPHTLTDAIDDVRPTADYLNTENYKLYYDWFTDRRARQLLTMAVNAGGLNATAHTDGIHAEISCVIDGLSGIEHAPESPAAHIYGDVATFIAKSGATQTMTYNAVVQDGLELMVRRYSGLERWPMVRHLVPPTKWIGVQTEFISGDYPEDGRPVDSALVRSIVQSAAQISARGGRVGVSSHGNALPIGYHYEMWLYALGGMPNYDILRSATIVGASALGHGHDLGSLEIGKLADLQILDLSPLVDIHNTRTIRYVMKNGRLYRVSDLAEVWPRPRPLPGIYRWN